MSPGIRTADDNRPPRAGAPALHSQGRGYLGPCGRAGNHYADANGVTGLTASYWINAALRSVIWFGLTVGLAFIRKPRGASIMSLRTDHVAWLGGGILLAGIALHLWSTVSLARGERHRASEPGALVAVGPFRYVRHPVYLAGITMLLGVGLLYPSWQATDLLVPLGLLAYFHVAVIRVEEPELRRRFGRTYDEYCERVPRWIPRRPASVPRRP